MRHCRLDRKLGCGGLEIRDLASSTKVDEEVQGVDVVEVVLKSLKMW